MNDIINYMSKELGGASPALTAAYLVVGVLILIMSVVCLVLEIRVWLCYSKANKRGISTNMTGIESARYVLDQAGLTQVKVRKATTTTWPPRPFTCAPGWARSTTRPR